METVTSHQVTGSAQQPALWGGQKGPWGDCSLPGQFHATSMTLEGALGEVLREALQSWHPPVQPLPEAAPFS